MEKPVLIRIENHLINPSMIVAIDEKGKGIFLSGTRYLKISDEQLEKILKYCTVIE